MSARAVFESLARDLRFALRMLGKAPAFTITAVLTLALGIGANTAIFTVVHGVLLKPLGYHDPDRLVRVSGGATAVRFEAIQQAKLLDVGGFFTGAETVTLAGPEGAEVLKGARVSANFTALLGVVPFLGRSFSAEDEGAATRVAMISAELWRRRFGADPGIVGRSATLGSSASTIVGVLPAGLDFPFPDIDVWRPWDLAAMPARVRLNSPIHVVFGRLRQNVTLEKANAELAVIHAAYARANPGVLDARPGRPDVAVPMKEHLVRNVRSTLWMLFGAVGSVLLIACANVAGLMLARSLARSREFAIRAALGAGRGRIAAQLLAESLLLAFAGGALGLVLAVWGVRGIARLPGLELPRVGDITLDAKVLGFALVLSIATSVIFGLIPSLAAARPDLSAALRTTGESSASAKGTARWLSPRGLLVVGQVALSVVLLIGASLLITSLARLRRVDPGFQPSNLLTMWITLPPERHDELVARVQAIPGVLAAAVTVMLPMTGYIGTPVQPADQAASHLNQRPIAVLQSVTPGFFRTLGIPLERGRDFAPRDTASAPPVAIVTRSLIRRFWPDYPDGEDPVGRHIVAGASSTRIEIVGIAADVRQAGLADAIVPGLYRPRSQVPALPAMFAVRTKGDPVGFVEAIRREVTAMDRDQAIGAVRTMDAVMDAAEARRRSIFFLLGLFASVGVLLAIVGIYGVVACSVAQRTKELAIRRALGAEPGAIVRLVLRQGFALAAAGALLGLAGAFGVTRLLESLLFEVSATDPGIFAGVAVALMVAALAASYVPARRAARIDPSSALRLA